MGTVLQWRKFNFFDIKKNIEGNLATLFKDCSVTCTGSGRGVIYVGDSSGFVHLLNRKLEITSFAAHSEAVKLIHASDGSNILITVQDNFGGLSELKLWSADRFDNEGRPVCFRTLRPDGRLASGAPKGAVPSGACPAVSAVALHPNHSFLALGFSNGSLMIFRGDIRRERGCKFRVPVTLVGGSVTNLHLRVAPKTCHLFATTQGRVFCINCTTKDKEITVELDVFGAATGCAAIADNKHENELLVARKDAIYTYTTDSRASCYVFEGYKESLSWFKGYMIVIAKEDATSRLGSSATVLTVYDPANKLVTLSSTLESSARVVGEWGGLYLVTEKGLMVYLAEKDLQTKFEILFKKNQFDIAINLAKQQCLDAEDISEILKQYGDWLYAKGDAAAAMQQFKKTIPHLEPSYVIKKYLDMHHIELLTLYLQALHKCGHATSDHTTLMLNCYTRLKDSQQMDNFVLEGESACDETVCLKVCRSAGFLSHAMVLAHKHGLHQHYVAILIEDKKDYSQALRYIWSLSLTEARDSLLTHGPALLSHVPEETTNLLVALCTNYKPKEPPTIALSEKLSASLAALSPPYVKSPSGSSALVDPEDFEYLLVGHNEATIAFLERVSAIRPLSPQLNTTLLAELLHQFSLAPEGQDQSALEEKILSLVRRADVRLDRDHALLLCDKHKFFAGKIILWEQAGMLEELLSWHASRGSFSSVVGVCERHGAAQPSLWGAALRLITDKAAAHYTPDASLLNTILNKIDELELMGPLEVVELVTSSAHITLGDVREFLLRALAANSASRTADSAQAADHRRNVDTMRQSIDAVTTETIEFIGTKCNVCNNKLDLPSVHFLCRHSFHVHCFETYSSENEADCPICLPENKKLVETIALQESRANRHELLQESLDKKSSDCFSVVADFLGRGVFTDLREVVALRPSPNTTKEQTALSSALVETQLSRQQVASSEGRVRTLEAVAASRPMVPEAESRLRVLENVKGKPSGSDNEARLRLHEGPKIPPLSTPSEARLRQTGQRKSIPAVLSETRLRVEASPRLKTKTPSPPPCISSMLGSTHVETRPENPFESDAYNPFDEDFETEKTVASNPFEEHGEMYPQEKNPFGDEDEQPRDKPATTSHNPFDFDDLIL